MIRKILLIGAAIICTNFSLLSQEIDTNWYQTVTYKVGKQPVALFYNQATRNSDTLNVICLGFNKNFDGILGEGDELPS
jgi:hypothetical protein